MTGMFHDWYSAQDFADELNCSLPYHKRAVVVVSKRGHVRRYSIVVRSL
jgi:hypothetical protein